MKHSYFSNYFIICLQSVVEITICCLPKINSCLCIILVLVRKCTPPPLHEKDTCIKSSLVMYKFSYLFKLQTSDSTIGFKK